MRAMLDLPVPEIPDALVSPGFANLGALDAP
jgi:hypothetical protein